MKAGMTEIVMVVDRSGSMEKLAKDTIGGFNNFLKEQLAVPGEARVTVVLFDMERDWLANGDPIQKVAPLNGQTYKPGGGTALLDALGTAIDRVGKRLALMPESERAEKVLVLVITDGEENSSKEYTLAQVKQMVQHQREVHKWEFVFIGAGIDALQVGESMGFVAGNSVFASNTPIGTRRLYGAMSAGVTKTRTSTGPATNESVLGTNNLTDDAKGTP